MHRFETPGSWSAAVSHPAVRGNRRAGRCVLRPRPSSRSLEEAMRPTVAVSLIFAVAASLTLTAHGDAGPEKIKFPADWMSYVLYTTVDRYDVKQYRELYASSAEAVQAMKAGRPLPHGTVLTMVSYKAQLDPQGNPTKDANGRFMRGDMAGIAVMEKQAGWGTEYPPDLRNGEWEYAIFT